MRIQEGLSPTLALHPFQAASSEIDTVTGLICILLEHSQSWKHTYESSFRDSVCLVFPPIISSHGSTFFLRQVGQSFVF